VLQAKAYAWFHEFQPSPSQESFLDSLCLGKAFVINFVINEYDLSNFEFVIELKI